MTDAPEQVTALSPEAGPGAAHEMMLIAGPCQMQSRAHALEVATALKAIVAELPVSLIFKTSFDKANRTAASAARGLGFHAALPVFAEIRDSLGLAVLTDVHETHQCAPVAEVVDVLQIPAFLCRQTDLLLAAAATERTVNVKKGQFMAPWDMRHVADKLKAGGATSIWLTERGASFGYNNLVVDMRSLVIMKGLGHPVIFDATHSVQAPGGLGGASGGDRTMVAPLARAAVAVGVDGVFIECHEDPENAPSDGPNMVALRDMPALLADLHAIDAARRANARRSA